MRLAFHVNVQGELAGDRGVGLDFALVHGRPGGVLFVCLA